MTQASQYGIVNRVKGAALCNVATMNNTYELCKRAELDNVPGAFVECGIYAGVNVAIMADVAMEAAKAFKRPCRQIEAFDSFEGIPRASIRDDESITALIGTELNPPGQIVSTGVSACSLEQVKKFMDDWGVSQAPINYHKGWFQDTVPMYAGVYADGIKTYKQASKIAVLRLDGDLYESTKVCLQYLYPLVSKGGYIIIDDYALTGCRAATEEYFDRLYGRVQAPVMQPIHGGDGPVWFCKHD